MFKVNYIYTLLNFKGEFSVYKRGINKGKIFNVCYKHFAYEIEQLLWKRNVEHR